MVFSSLSFIYAFFPLVVILYYLCKNRVYRNVVLLLSSLFFYAWGEPKYIAVMLCSVLCAYLGGLLIAHFKQKEQKKLSLVAMICTAAIIVSFLLIFKYLNLFVDTFNSIFAVDIPIRRFVLPIGISFYTFQILSYVVDLYWGKVNLQRNYFDLLLYVCFFPQLIAGPIVRYETVELELRSRKESWDDFVRGMELFIFGLAKKVILANNLALVSDSIYQLGIGNVGTLMAWIAALCYTLQIYFDFSGYSDMAIGLGRMFGFHFPQNFNYPYTATSVTEFWRRWHISLSTWFRDYIYVPLGGNRVKPWRHILNILAVWAMTGFWHGAQWSFLLWGLYYGLILLIEKFLMAKLLKKLPIFVKWVYTFVLVMIGWVIFSNESIPEIIEVLKAMFTFSSRLPLEALASNSAFVLSALSIPFAIVFAFPVAKRFTESETVWVTAVREVVCLLLLGVCIAFLLSSTYNPFIYFRF